MDTIDNGLLRENLLKSEALLTLSLNSDVEANSAPTLHGKNDEPPVLGVGALFADALTFLESMVVWPLSRPNRSLYRARGSEDFSNRHVARSPRFFLRHQLARR